jgi:dihydrofolate reductase
MRKIVAGLFVSLDGVVEAPEKWNTPYFNEEMAQEVGAQMAEADTMLLGRVTYETFAAAFAGQTGGMADVMNSTPKIVVSTTLDEAAWQNSTLLNGNGDLVEQLTALKHKPGRNIAISGSGTLISSLLREGLLDELRLLVHPIVVGSGKRLFDDGEQIPLKLVGTKALQTGVVALHYEPADA